MIIEQTIEIPENRRLIIDVPRDIPAGKMILTFTPVSTPGSAEAASGTIEDAVREAERKAANPGHTPFFGLGGSLKDSPRFGGSGIAIQRELRAEWESVNG
jgi:hypothetical protein